MKECLDINLEKEINKALCYVADNLNKTGHNSKPVLLHSFQVAMTLYYNGYDRNIVLAGALHDLIEDTDITKEDITKIYNEDIANIVACVSFKADIKDRYMQAKEMFDRCVSFGYPALIVKCADLLNNINYVCFADKNIQEGLVKKYKLFLDMSREIIGNEEIFNRLEEKYISL